MSLLLFFSGVAGRLGTVAATLALTAPAATLSGTGNVTLTVDPAILVTSAPAATLSNTHVRPAASSVAFSAPTAALVPGMRTLTVTPALLVFSGGTAAATIDLTSPIITIAGVSANSRVRQDSLVITDELDEAPNTCAFNVQGTAPTTGQEVIVALGALNNKVFAGHITQVEQGYEGIRANVLWRVTCVDYTRLLDRRKVIKRYTAQSASAIVADILSTYTTGFTAANVASGLATVDEITFTMDEVSRALTRLAKTIGASWYVDYDRDVHFFITETVDAPDSITDAQLEVRNLTKGSDLSQIRTRVVVEGGGSKASVEVAVGATTIPVDDGAWYATGGGVVKSGPQRITYTGKSTTDGGGSTVAGSPLSPSAPSPAVVDGTAGSLDVGAYTYKVAHVVNGAESDVSSASVAATVTNVSAPTAPSPAVTAGTTGNLDAGVYQYAVSYGTSAGETEVSSVGSATISHVTAPGAPTPTSDSITPGNLQAGHTYRYKTTFVTSAGETTASSASSGVTISAVSTPGSVTPTATTGGSMTAGATYHYAVTFVTLAGETAFVGGTPVSLGVNTAVSLTAVDTSADSRVVARRIYRTGANLSAPYKLVTTIGDNTTTSYTDTKADSALGEPIPTTDTSGSGRISLAGIPTSADGRVTKRRLYRLEYGGTVYKLLTTISDNTTTTYADNTADSGLTLEEPTANTTGTGRITVTIPTSADGRVTKRYLYRTAAGESILKRLTTISNNTTTTYADNTSDASLSDEAPAANDSGSGRITLSSIALGPTGTTARRLYRTTAGGSTYKYLGIISDNVTTTFADNVADGSLGAEAPTASRVGAKAGDTTLRSADLSQHPASGWVRCGEQIITYTGRSAASGEGTLTGIPASGVGAIGAGIASGVSIVNHPHLTGVSGIAYTIKSGDDINVLVTRNDTSAQTALAAIEGGDGIHEHYIQDRRLSIASCEELGDAELTLFSTAEASLTFTSRDTKLRSGKSIVVNLGAPTNISGTFKIQRVVMTQFGLEDTYPLRQVTASSYLFTIDHLLRRVVF